MWWSFARHLPLKLVAVVLAAVLWAYVAGPDGGQPTARAVRLVADVRGQPATGYVIERVLIDPAAVQLVGPRSTIERRETVATEPVDVSGRRSTLARTVAVALPDGVRLVRDARALVTVEIRAEDRMQQQRQGTTR